MPPWLWIGVAAMAVVAVAHPARHGRGAVRHGRSTLAWGRLGASRDRPHSHLVGAVDRCRHAGSGGGILSAAVLALGWTTMMNGYPIVFCPPTCVPGSPLSDIAHIGSLVLGPLAALAAIWALWRVARGWDGCCHSGRYCWSLRCLRRSAARPSSGGVAGPTSTCLRLAPRLPPREGTTGPGGGADLVSRLLGGPFTAVGRTSFGCGRTRKAVRSACWTSPRWPRAQWRQPPTRPSPRRSCRPPTLRVRAQGGWGEVAPGGLVRVEDWPR